MKTVTARLNINAESFIAIMDRALNVLPPEEWPEWTKTIAHVSNGVRPTDTITLVMTREVPQ